MMWSIYLSLFFIKFFKVIIFNDNDDNSLCLKCVACVNRAEVQCFTTGTNVNKNQVEVEILELQ